VRREGHGTRGGVWSASCDLPMGDVGGTGDLDSTSGEGGATSLKLRQRTRRRRGKI
jgi:hypothetical protein